MEAISLKKNQEIRDIRMEPASNGGCVLSYEIYTPSMQHSESTWDRKTEIFTDEQMESVALPRIMELYKADYANAMIKQNNKMGISTDPPVAAKEY